MSSDKSTSNSSISDSSEEIDYTKYNLDLHNQVINNNYVIIKELGRGACSIVWMVYNIKNDSFDALKVHNYDEYEDAKEEVKFSARLPNHSLFNKIREVFVILKNKKKYVCCISKLFAGNLDMFIRKGFYHEGFDNDVVEKIMKQLIEGLNFLHKKMLVYHGDIKPDNILLYGNNIQDEFIITSFRNHKHFSDIKSDPVKYSKLILNDIMDEAMEKEIYDCDSKYFKDPKIAISDFGNFCDLEDKFDEVVGTRYYMAPEVILLGNCDHRVDYWALGCTCYELLTGKVLFDPERKEYDTNHEHLCEIISLCGKIPKKVIKKSKFGKKYFNKNYKLKNFKKVDKMIDIEFMRNFIERLINPEPKLRTMYI